jgi:hypothetical protein
MERSDCEGDGQLDYVGVTESTHVFDLTLNTIFCASHIDNVFRDELHCDLVTREGMYGHWQNGHD